MNKTDQVTLNRMVNNAAVNIEAVNPRPIWDTEESTWDLTQRINVKGVFLGCKYASRQMLTQEPHRTGDRGWIINIASVLGMVATQDSAAYCAAKGAVINLTKAAAMDCAPDRIHVNAVCPGSKRCPKRRASIDCHTNASPVTLTAMTERLRNDVNAQEHIIGLHPFRGLGIPDDIAGVVVFLASDDASWVTGVSSPKCLGFELILVAYLSLDLCAG